MRVNSFLFLSAMAVVAGGCSKKAAPPSPPPPSPPAASRPEVRGTPPPAAQATPPADSPPAAPPEDPELAAKRKAVQTALAEQAILEEPKGQWATTASASSRYNDVADGGVYSPQQATGRPDIEHAGDNANAWAPRTSDSGIEWLQLGFGKPVHATEVRVRQNAGPGAIIKIELIDDQGGRHTVFDGVDQTKYESGAIGWFKQTFEKTPYLVVATRVTLATNSVPGWNEIDAVQLIGD